MLLSFTPLERGRLLPVQRQWNTWLLVVEAEVEHLMVAVVEQEVIERVLVLA
jgi:hypothetical protein